MSGDKPPSAAALLSAVLVSEAVVIGLAVPVAVAVEQVEGRTAGLVCGGLAVACLLLAGLVRRRRWAVAAGGVLQVLLVASGFMVATMFFLGVLFGALWGTAIWLGHKVADAGAR